MSRRRATGPDVRSYFEQQSPRYLDDRYLRPSCEQLSYQSRRRLALEFLGRGPGRVIDIGSGPGILSIDILARDFTLCEVDIALEMLRESRRRLQHDPARGRVRFVEACLPALPFTSGSFDAATCLGVFSYVDNPATSLREIRRLLKPGGVLVMQASNALCPTARLHTALRRSYHRIGAALGGRDYPHLRIPLASFRLRMLREMLEQERFQLDGYARYDFRPPLLEWITPRLALASARWLQRLERSRLGWIAEGMILRARAC